MYDVPEDYQLPYTATTLKQAFELWLRGDQHVGVRPYRELTQSSFGPKREKVKKHHGVDLMSAAPKYYADIQRNKKTLTDWKRVMVLLEKPIDSYDTGPVGDRYTLGITYLRDNYVGYVFDKPRVTQLGISSWSKFVKDSEVWRCGLPGDLKKLGGRKRKTCPDATGWRFHNLA